MIRQFKDFVKTELIQTLFFSSLSTFFKAATGLILNKVVASLIGPVGVALVGQFTNFLGIITTIGSGGIETGVVKYVAEHKKNDAKARSAISTAGFVILACSTITAVCVFVFAGYFSYQLFHHSEYKYIIRLAAVSLILISLKSLLMAVLNGYREVTKYTSINVITSISTLVISLLLIVKYKLIGVLIALIAGQIIGFIVTLFFTIKHHWFSIKYFFLYFDKIMIRKLSAYSIMTLVAAFTFPFTLLLVRNYIGSHLSWKDAGYWQGVWMISEGYMTFIISAVSFYYLPRLSELSGKKEMRVEIVRISKIIMPLVTAIALAIFLFKNFIVTILFTSEFTPMLPLFKYQLAGDVIRFAGWLISYEMISKGMTQLYVLTTVFFNLSFVLLSVLFIKITGLEGVAVAFFLNAALYLLIMMYVFKNTLFKGTSIPEINNLSN